MKKSIQITLGSAIAVAIFFVLSFHVSSCSGTGGSGDSTGPGNNPKLFNTGINQFPAGAIIVLECKDCNGIDLKNPLNPNAIVISTIPIAIPPNTDLKLVIYPKGDPKNP